MTVHLRAAGYRHRKQTPAGGSPDLMSRNEARSSKALSFSNLLRDYDNQARNNFTREAVLFAIIVLIGILWPLAQMFRDLPR